ncbi:MAG: hypothetical protein JNJ74_09135, partial [Xanthomonadales bacterium]|nr:hypothetical protein [Xanthomonadales bacterium]
AWFLERTPEGLKAEPAPQGNKRVVGAAIVLAALAVGWYLRGQPVAEQIPSPGGDARWTVAEAGKVAPESAAEKVDGAPAAPDVPAAEAHAAPRRSVAVLPFVNMSGDAEQEYFADGLSEEILNSLTRIDGMQVAGRTSSFQFKGKNEDLRSIGQKLGVASVLEGSVRRGKDAMRITAQLIRVSDGIHVWSQTYDRAPEDTLAVQLDIAEHVAGALDVVLDDVQRERMRQSGVKNVEAFIAFQKGQRLYRDAHDPDRSSNLIATLRLANVEFARATALEPDFAAAYYAGTDLYSHIVLTTETSAAERTEALDAARRDLALASRHAHDAPTRALIEVDRQLISDDWRGLAARLKAATITQGCRQASWLLVGNALGVAQERAAAMRQFMACDPLSGLGVQQASSAASWAGQPETALALIAQGEAAMGGSDSITMQKVRALVTLGRLDEARVELPSLSPGSAERVIAELLVAAASGADVASVAARSRDDRHLGWNPGYWEAADFLAEALLDDRAAGDRRAAAIDAVPGGALKLAILVSLCQCGVPFDIEVTPDFKARLAESGSAWPPVDLIAGLRKSRDSAP